MSASRPNESAWNMVQRYGLYWESPNKGKKKTMRFLSLNRQSNLKIGPFVCITRVMQLIHMGELIKSQL